MASVRVSLSLLLLAVTGSVLAQAPGGAKKPLSIDDLYRFDAPTHATLSPDGNRLAYVRRWLNAKSKRERHSLWLVEGLRDKARALEADEPDARATPPCLTASRFIAATDFQVDGVPSGVSGKNR